MNPEENRKMQYIAEKGKFLRTYDLMNLKDLAAKLKLHRERIMNLETGVYRVDLQDVIWYCDYFGLDYQGFLSDVFPNFKAAYVADAMGVLNKYIQIAFVDITDFVDFGSVEKSERNPEKAQ